MARGPGRPPGEGHRGQRAAAREPAGRPARAAVVGLPPAGLSGRDPAVPGVLLASRLRRERRELGEPPGLRPPGTGDDRRRVRDGAGTAGDRRKRRRLDAIRREPVHRLERDWQVSLLPVRRDRPLCRRSVPHDRGPRSPGGPGQVLRRIRGARRLHAQAGCLQRLRQPRRGRVLRDCLPAPPARSRAGPAFLGRRHHGLVERLPGSLARRAARRAPAPVCPRRLGLLLARPGRRSRAPRRHQDRRDPARCLAPVARLGSRAHDPPPRGPAPVHARRVDRRWLRG